MPPVLHCVRHAQGFHNLSSEFHKLYDPRLTPLGEEQCMLVKSDVFPDQSRISLVTASPLSRTIHTAAIAFEPALRGKKILAIPDVQEISDLPCDTGSEIETLKRICEESSWPVDMSLLHEGWNRKVLGERYSPASHAVRARAKDARLLLRQKMRHLVASGDENAEVILVTHGGFLHYFTNDWENASQFIGTGFRNVECRTYIFQKGLSEEDEQALLSETMESRHARGLDHPMYSKDKQEYLFEECMQGWESQGLGNATRLDNGAITVKSTGQEPATDLTGTESSEIKTTA